MTRSAGGSRRRQAPKRRHRTGSPDRARAVRIERTDVTPRALLSAASWGDVRDTPRAPIAPELARRSVPLDRIADALSEQAFMLPDPDLSDGPACVRAAYGAPVGERVDRPVRGVVRRCGERRRETDAVLLAACWETVDLARRHAHHDALRTVRPAPDAGRTTVAPARRRRALPRPSRLRGLRATRQLRVPGSVAGRVVRLLLLVLAVAAGLRWALPLQGVEGRCPPSGEGYGYCYLQKSVLPAVIVFLAPILGAQVLGTFLTQTGPDLLRRWRAGERPTRTTTRQMAAPYDEDPVLLAASWGVRTGIADRDA